MLPYFSIKHSEGLSRIWKSICKFYLEYFANIHWYRSPVEYFIWNYIYWILPPGTVEVVQPDGKDTKDQIEQEKLSWENKLRKSSDLWLVCTNLRFMCYSNPFPSSFRNLDTVSCIFCSYFSRFIYIFFFSFSEEDKVYNQHKDLLLRRIKSFLLSTGTPIVLLFPFSSIFL